MSYEDVLAALAHPNRREIMTVLKARSGSVREVHDRLSARGLSLSQPLLSQHLKILKDARLVTATPSGARQIYQIEPEGLASLRRYLEDHWAEVLQGLDNQGDDND